MEVNYRFVFLEEAAAKDTLEGSAADDVKVDSVDFAIYNGWKGRFTVYL